MVQDHSTPAPSRRSLLKLVATAGAGIAAGGATPAAAAPPAFAHPGLLHTKADFDRMAAKVKAVAQLYQAGWQRLTANRHAQSDWKPNPPAVIVRGRDAPQNYPTLYDDVHAAYQNALRWQITGDRACRSRRALHVRLTRPACPESLFDTLELRR